MHRLIAAAAAAAIGLPALVLVASCHGCGTSDDAGSTTGKDAGSEAEAEAGADVRLDIASEADSAGGDGTDARDTEPLPDGTPPGWQEWTGWSNQCPLYVPGDGAEMPPPIEWEPCSAAVPSYLDCRRMKDTWSGAGLGISGYPNFTLDPQDGKPLLQFTRIRIGGDENISYRLVAEADGVVRNAILNLDSVNNDCGYLEKDVYKNLFAHYVHTRTGSKADGSAGDEYGFLGGPIDVSPPTTVFRPADATRPSSWFISDRWIIQFTTGRHEAWNWDFSESQMVYSSALDPDGLPPFKATLVGGDVFSTVGTNNHCGMMSWSLEHGSRPLLRWYGDTSHGAGNFDTDGKDMVWTYSSGPKGCGVDASNPEVWTAPYTTDPAEVATNARRLRKDKGGMSADAFAVGHGYSMRTVGTGGLYVVRLSDGNATFMKDYPSGQKFAWGDVLGFDSEELFVTIYYDEGFAGETIARIRLQSLPFDLPPD
jgi:hypothetical protein